MGMKSSDLITELKGIGPKTAALFHKLNVETIDDLIHLYPRYYITYESPIEAADLKVGDSTAYTVEYIVASSIEKLYTFTVTEEVLNEVEVLCDRYRNRFIEKELKSLEILQTLC